MQECVFRPKPHSVIGFILSYKMGNEIIVNEEVTERETEMEIGGYKFENFDQIYQQYYMKKLQIVKGCLRCPEFTLRFGETERMMLLENSKNHTRFKFRFCQKRPGSLGMVYFIDKLMVEEVIKVEPRNLVFHGIDFMSLEEIAKFVQEKFVDSSYEEYIGANPEQVIKEGKEI